MSPVNLVSQRGLTSQRWLEKAYVGVSHMKLFNCRLLSQCVTGTAVTKFIFQPPEKQRSPTVYEELVMYLLTSPTVRVVVAVKALLEKAHFYESLANLQSISARWDIIRSFCCSGKSFLSNRVSSGMNPTIPDQKSYFWYYTIPHLNTSTILIPNPSTKKCCLYLQSQDFQHNIRHLYVARVKTIQQNSITFSWYFLYTCLSNSFWY